jgi:hypothetical protein
VKKDEGFGEKAKEEDNIKSKRKQYRGPKIKWRNDEQEENYKETEIGGKICYFFV